MGWVTVAAYLGTAGLAAMVARGVAGRLRLFWLLLALLLLGLAVNKQLDLQSALTALARCLAQAQGWYAERRGVQLRFIALVVAVGLVVTIVAFWLMRRHLGQVWLALVGLAALLTFVAIRAAGFHHIDRLIGHEVMGVRMNWILELGGIVLIALNALALLRRSRHGRAAA